jgi:hypothetical protein
MILTLDPLYWMLMIPAFLLAGIAALMTKSTFSKYSRVGVSSGFTGAQAAQRLLTTEGVHDVSIEPVQGFLSDHYDPSSRTLRLSPKVYGSKSLSAIGVACHEAGHAIQHAHNYGPLALRTAMVPIASVGSNFAFYIIFAGLIFGWLGMVKIGIILFGAAVVFSIVTLPVEWDASARAKRLMVTSGICDPREQVYAGRVLNAAFMTYVAGAITSILTLLYFLLRSGLLGGGDD